MDPPHSWHWKITNDIRGVEIPDLDEEQLPHSLRIVFAKGGAVCCIACQTSEDLVNLRRGTKGPSLSPYSLLDIGPVFMFFWFAG